MEATKEEVKEDKLIAILTRPGIEPVVVEITDTDKKSWTAFVLSPAGLEYHVSIDDLHGVEHIVDGKRKFMGEPRRTPEKDIPNNIVVRDQKEVLV